MKFRWISRVPRLAVGSLLWGVIGLVVWDLASSGGGPDPAPAPAAMPTLPPVPAAATADPEPLEDEAARAARLEAARQEAWDRIEPRLFAFAEEIFSGREEDLEELEDFMVQTWLGGVPFAEEILSIEGKVAMLAGVFDQGAYDQFVRSAFERHVLDVDELTRVVEATITRFLGRVEEAENRLLIDIRADLDGIGAGDSLRIDSVRGDAAFRVHYGALAAEIEALMVQDAGVLLGKFLVDEIVSSIITGALMELAEGMGVSPADLGMEDVEWGIRLGINVLVSLALDEVLSWALSEAGYNPSEKITAEVGGFVERLSSLILLGDEDPGLLEQMEAYAEERFRISIRTLHRLVFEEDES
ncbi:hypothetical protein AB1L88_16895 [Tautonia sp. JC769]|uniref:hypothetical protein n=1 Tax=Tautonia sp. JC769 TaxID=3232135 RepID=UPI00345A0C89